MRVVVEGVETGEQLALLGELGSDFAQGCFLGHPAPAVDVVLGKPLVRIDSVTQGRLLEPLLRTRTCKQRGK
jgi:EAL domain-containing protein (putative c-di-GMP-specific phosphodiesterase class I)